jgi:choline dehydrogenase-like flavoprotein
MIMPPERQPRVGDDADVLSGAIGSPHILQLSGIGDPDHLDRIGVPVVHELRVSRRVVRAQTAWRSAPSDRRIRYAARCRAANFASV